MASKIFFMQGQKILKVPTSFSWTHYSNFDKLTLSLSKKIILNLAIILIKFGVELPYPIFGDKYWRNFKIMSSKIYFKIKRFANWLHVFAAEPMESRVPCCQKKIPAREADDGRPSKSDYWNRPEANLNKPRISTQLRYILKKRY